MIAVELRFPAGRFHATPWGRHVNEGAVEWPVEPWRLLRALMATWFHKAQTAVEKPTLVRLITSLSETLPVYRLPGASLGHTRHYMPFNEGKNEKTTKIFDAFVHVAEGEAVHVAWDIHLSEADRTALALLLNRLGYLGRAESLVEAALWDGVNIDYNTRPLAADESATDAEELVQVLAPFTPGEYTAWRQGYLQSLASTRPASKSKKATGDPVPADVFDALLADTGVLKSAGWNLPPGARRVAYVRPANAFKMSPVPSRGYKSKANPTVARFALASAVLPSITATVSLGDRVHQSLVSRGGKQPVFTGLDVGGEPLKDHRHAFILPECDLESDRIRFLTVFASGGFDENARRTLSGLQKVWGHGGHDIQMILLGFGEPADFAGTNPGSGQSLILSESAEWVSLTPFIPTRHGKQKANGAPRLDDTGLQIGGPEHDLRRLLKLHLPEAEIVSIAKTESAPTHRPLRWLQFQRGRKTGNGLRAGEFGFGFRVQFKTAVSGPIAVGYGAHFGLGLFCPADAAQAAK